MFEAISQAVPVVVQPQAQSTLQNVFNLILATLGFLIVALPMLATILNFFMKPSARKDSLQSAIMHAQSIVYELNKQVRTLQDPNTAGVWDDAKAAEFKQLAMQRLLGIARDHLEKALGTEDEQSVTALASTLIEAQVQASRSPILSPPPSAPQNPGAP